MQMICLLIMFQGLNDINTNQFVSSMFAVSVDNI